MPGGFGKLAARSWQYARSMTKNITGAYLMKWFVSGAALFLGCLIIYSIVRPYKQPRRQVKQSTGMQRSQESSLEHAPYLRKLHQVLVNFERFPSSASMVLPHLYLGGESDATNIAALKKLGITHVINCAAGYTNTGPNFYGKEFKYWGFEGEDDWNYDIMQHFQKTFDFIEKARVSGGKVLIHCLMGVNRSGALSTAYVMVHENTGPITAARKVKKARHMVLTNEQFQRQLISLADKKGYLEKDRDQLDMKD